MIIICELKAAAFFDCKTIERNHKQSTRWRRKETERGMVDERVRRGGL